MKFHALSKCIAVWVLLCSIIDFVAAMIGVAKLGYPSQLTVSAYLNEIVAAPFLYLAKLMFLGGCLGALNFWLYRRR